MDLLITIAFVVGYIATAALFIIHWPSGLVALAILLAAQELIK